MSAAYDAIVIGGGHNGLTAAAYLAKAGLARYCVVEAADGFGGAAVTREFAPGFKVSAVAHLLHGLHPTHHVAICSWRSNGLI